MLFRRFTCDDSDISGIPYFLKECVAPGPRLQYVQFYEYNKHLT